MAVGYTDQYVAEAYYRREAILDAIGRYRQFINMAQDAMSYKYDPMPFYDAAYSWLKVINTSIDEFRRFIERYADKLREQGVYDSMVASVDTLLGVYEGLESTIVTPRMVTVPTTEEDPSFKGVVTEVVDGDTVLVGTRVVRLAGIDAKEAGTAHGQLAKKFLEDLVLGKEVEFKVDPHVPYDTYGRTLAVPFVDGVNVCVEMLAHCMAKVNTKYGRHHYVDPDEYKQAADRCVLTYPVVNEYKIISDPPKCSVIIDGKDIGDVTPATVLLTPGVHRITLYKPGYSALHDYIYVGSKVGEDLGKSVEQLVYKLHKVGEQVGLVDVRVVPDSVVAAIYVDGDLVGAAPIILSLPTMVESTIKAVADGYNPSEVKTVAEIGQVRRVILNLTPAASSPAP